MKDAKLVEFIQRVISRQETAEIPVEPRIWAKLLNLASRNRVLYYFASEIRNKHFSALAAPIKGEIETIIKEGNHWQERLKNTLIFINGHFRKNNIPFLIVKTRRNIPYVTYDVDVLIKERDFLKTKEILKNQGELARHPGKQSQKQVNFFANELLTVDIHEDFTWQGFSYLDQEEVWNNCAESEIACINVPIPRPEIEFLLYSAHLIYERRYVTLLDLNNLIAAADSNLDYSLILEQTEKYGWNGSFLKLISLLNALSCQTYPYFKDVFGIRQAHPLKVSPNLEMPFFIPLNFVYGFFKEKINFTKKIPCWDISYYIYATLRYYISGKKSFPYYIDWHKE